MYFTASVFMAFPWALLVAFGAPPWGLFVPFLLGGVGMIQSLSSRPEQVDLVIGNVTPSDGVRPLRRAETRQKDNILLDGLRVHSAPLRIAQITDPHLGPFMSVRRLRAISQRLADQNPDLVVLTGDFLTMESQSDESHLIDALLPLAKLEGKIFACLGNHDHEAPRTVRNALAAIGARLLVDEAVTIDTRVGPVQILGFDFHFTHRSTHMKRACELFPRQEGALRLVLLHDPGAFKHLPPGDADLVLSGHTHGGQVGLVSLGREGTAAWWVAKIPDHGLWGNGPNRLYVHRGTGHYGFPLRLGVPAEQSILSVYVATGDSPSDLPS
jgi:predicted MPP superfamily phosphohydrolase